MTESEYKSFEPSASLDFPGYSLRRRQDEIIELRFNPAFAIEVSDVKHIISVIKSIKPTGKCLFLILFEEDNTFSTETREYMASDEVSEIIKASAMVIKGLALEILGSGYIKINNPRRPVQLFKSGTAAVEWLNRFRHI